MHFQVPQTEDQNDPTPLLSPECELRGQQGRLGHGKKPLEMEFGSSV